jgi:hypothetical protein
VTDHRFNVFVPPTAPQYAEMVRRGGRPGVSLENRERHGVWVPLEWMGEDTGRPVKTRWVPLSAEALRGIYGNGHVDAPVREPDEPV